MDTPPATPIHSARASLDRPSVRTDVSKSFGAGSSNGQVMEDGILLYPYEQDDYETRREIGRGQFSIVYEAIPRTLAPLPESQEATRKRNDSVLSPPATPIKPSLQLPSRVLAIKRPVDKSAARVCRDEARILSQLQGIKDHERYTVAFHGLDARSNAIIMDLMPSSLDGFIKDPLNGLLQPQRTDLVAASFKHLAACLFRGVRWLHLNNFVHGDIKPGNILLRPSDIASLPAAMRYDPIFADFSSATTTSNSPSSPREAPIAGGTWDYMYFGHIKDSTEDHELLNDSYGLVMTLLVFVVGASPYAWIGNRYLQADSRKKGRPMEFVSKDPDLAGRMMALEDRDGFGDIGRRFERAAKGEWNAVLG